MRLTTGNVFTFSNGFGLVVSGRQNIALLVTGDLKSSSGPIPSDAKIADPKGFPSEIQKFLAGAAAMASALQKVY